MHNLLIQLLGNFTIRYDEETVKIPSQRLQDFLVYLLLHRGVPQNRQQLSYLFWPESSDRQSQTNLRNLIYLLKKSLPVTDEFLTTDSQYIIWRESPALSLDVATFELLVNTADQIESSKDLDSLELILESIVDICHGDLVPSCYANWIIPHRNKLHNLYIHSLERLISVKEMRSKYQEAVNLAQMLRDSDPLNEANYRTLIHLYSLIGDQASLVRSYYDCVEIMKRELDIEPSIITKEFYERERRRDLILAQQNKAIPNFPLNIPLIGRRQEWNQLLAAWQKASEGNTCIVLINGENGLGKTRLAQEFVSWAEESGIRTASACCYPADRRLAYAPIISWLRSKPLPSLDDNQLTEIARILPELLVGRHRIDRPNAVSEKWQLQHFFEALKSAFFPDQTPLLLFLDDLEWIDYESLEWLYYILRFSGNLPLLIVASICLDNLVDDEQIALFLNSIQRTGQLTEITLTALTMEETAILAKQLSGGELLSSWLPNIFRETEGFPLLVVELIRSGWIPLNPEFLDANQSQSAGNLPPVVQAAINKRLAHLSAQARQLIDLAATIGYKVPFSVLASASGMREELLVQALDELTKRHILREVDAESYIFTYTKLQEVIYGLLSTARKRIYHRQVSEALQRSDIPRGHAS